jgi:hypothetical protein
LLKGIALDQDLFDLISTHLPNVEAIACQGKKWNTYFFDKPVPNNITINLRAFRNLNKFALDFNALVPDDFDSIMLMVIRNAMPLKGLSLVKRLTATVSEIVQLYTRPTAEYIKECSENESVTVRSITFECNKIKEVMVTTKLLLKFIMVFLKLRLLTLYTTLVAGQRILNCVINLNHEITK